MAQFRAHHFSTTPCLLPVTAAPEHGVGGFVYEVTKDATHARCDRPRAAVPARHPLWAAELHGQPVEHDGVGRAEGQARLDQPINLALGLLAVWQHE